MRILNIGSMNLDYVYGLDSIVRPGETVSARSLDVVPGGKGLNQSIAFARAGAWVYHAGCYGNGGETLVGLLSENGVDTSLVKKADAPQGNAIIQVENGGNNSIIVFGGSNRCLTREGIDEILSGFGEGDLITLQNEVNELDYIISAAKNRGLTVLLNPSPYDSAIDRVDLDCVDWLIMNEVESAALAGGSPETAWETLHKKYPRLSAVITLGTGGAYLYAGDAVIYQPAFCVKAVDTTAAGDTFTGYLFAMIAAGKDYAEAMLIASKAAAIGVTRPGAAPSVPVLAEVLSASF